MKENKDILRRTCKLEGMLHIILVALNCFVLAIKCNKATKKILVPILASWAHQIPSPCAIFADVQMLLHQSGVSIISKNLVFYKG